MPISFDLCVCCQLSMRTGPTSMFWHATWCAGLRLMLAWLARRMAHFCTNVIALHAVCVSMGVVCCDASHVQDLQQAGKGWSAWVGVCHFFMFYFYHPCPLVYIQLPEVIVRQTASRCAAHTVCVFGVLLSVVYQCVSTAICACSYSCYARAPAVTACCLPPIPVTSSSRC